MTSPSPSCLARADRAPLLCALTQHDASAVKRHLTVHTAARRADAHFLLEAERASQPFESAGNVAVKE
jgi:hypothetical protein